MWTESIFVLLCVANVCLGISGGYGAVYGQYASQVSIQDANYNHLCSGTILDENNVITTAKCVTGVPLTDLRILYGTIMLKEGGQITNVKAIIPHAGYEANTLENNIAIVKLKYPLIFNKYVQPITRNENDLEDDNTAIPVGWGGRHQGENVTDQLQYIYLRSMNSRKCKESLQGKFDVLGEHLCSAPKPNEGPCQGDEGGLLTDYDRAFIGITSWVPPTCGEGVLPSVYTDIRAHKKWIDEALV